jgi:hypothetical protein
MSDEEIYIIKGSGKTQRLIKIISLTANEIRYRIIACSLISCDQNPTHLNCPLLSNTSTKTADDVGRGWRHEKPSVFFSKIEKKLSVQDLPLYISWKKGSEFEWLLKEGA